MKELRDYQKSLSLNGVEILKANKIVYLMMSVRTGKTATSLEIARLYGAFNVLFLTKKKAVNGVIDDFMSFGFSDHMNLFVTNDESMHKIDDPMEFDVIIHDEHHRFGSFPKPGKYTKSFREMFFDKPMIFLSGTPTPESFSQMYHQMWVSYYSPWFNYRNFYAWSKDYVNVKQKRIGAYMHNDYSFGDEAKIMKDISHLIITYTQEQAGFKSSINETIMHVDMHKRTMDMADRLLADRVIEGKNEVILADTAAKLMQKLHQLYSGTIKFESGNSMVLDTSKAEFIKKEFEGKKIGIFYVFKEELNALSQVFGSENLTTDLDEFNSSDKSIALQVVSGREGISLRNADYIVFYNIQHSAVSYFQAIDRMTTIDRLNNDVFWIFSRGGIEDKIYKVVKNKKKYTLNIFKKDYLN